MLTLWHLLSYVREKIRHTISDLTFYFMDIILSSQKKTKNWMSSLLFAGVFNKIIILNWTGKWTDDFKNLMTFMITWLELWWLNVSHELWLWKLLLSILIQFLPSWLQIYGKMSDFHFYSQSIFMTRIFNFILQNLILIDVNANSQ